jgi:hypothetical protein
MSGERPPPHSLTGGGTAAVGFSSDARFYVPVSLIRQATIPEDPGSPSTSNLSLLGAFVMR